MSRITGTGHWSHQMDVAAGHHHVQSVWSNRVGVPASSTVSSPRSCIVRAATAHPSRTRFAALTTSRPASEIYNRQHRHYCGIDLHVKTMYVCILDQYDGLINDLEVTLVRDAKRHDADVFHRLRSVPGIGTILALTILYEVHDMTRFLLHAGARHRLFDGEVPPRVAGRRAERRASEPVV